VVGDLPTRELPGAEVDAGREVEVRAVRDGEVGDVADVAAVWLPDAEVALDQVGEAASGLVRIVVFTRRRSRIDAARLGTALRSREERNVDASNARRGTSRPSA